MVKQDKTISTFTILSILGILTLFLLIGWEIWHNLWSGALIFIITIFTILGMLLFAFCSIGIIISQLEGEDY